MFGKKMKSLPFPLLAAGTIASCNAPALPPQHQASATVEAKSDQSVAIKRKLDPLEELIRRKARLREDQVLSIASALALREKRDLSGFEPPEIRATMSEKKKITWSIVYLRPNIVYIAPGDRPSITIDDETGDAKFDLQM
jgi:hypothetical protein